jgi:hypothetical protein
LFYEKLLYYKTECDHFYFQKALESEESIAEVRNIFCRRKRSRGGKCNLEPTN